MRPRQLAFRRRLRPELIVLAAAILWTLAPLFTLLGGHGVFNGGYGGDVGDLMQYMAFIRDAGQHILISNRFDVVPDPHVFLDPVFALSGLAWRLGASIQLALLWWVPVSLAAMWLGFNAYVRHLVPGARARAVALLLAFLFLTPTVALSDWLGGSPGLRFGTQVIGREMFAGGYAWSGGPALAIALMPAFLLCVQRLLQTSEPAGDSRASAAHSAAWYGSWASITGLLITWIHPWQGMTLLVILAALVIWGRFARRYLVLAVPGLLTAAPLLYYFVLSHTHSSWMRMSAAGGFAHFGLWLPVALLPVMVALGGLRGPALDVRERILRLWPLAGLTVYLSLDRTWFYHAFASLSLPLAVLTVNGMRRLRLPTAAVAGLLVLFMLPGLIWAAQQLLDARSSQFFTHSEARALRFLSTTGDGGAVMAPPLPLGQAIPGFTGRQTYVGHYLWTPDYVARTQLTEALFDGRLSIARTRALVQRSGVRFLASDCAAHRTDLRKVLGPLLQRSWRLGCATVYEVFQPPSRAQVS